ncbi:MAG TPA: DEDD exonuclease domain-containing protein [Mycobacteriales bacterium]|nr:DEDD exonuclease domain-containing protein [Mycobacteriales bacterium]
MTDVQGSFDELGRPLASTTFVVVDLETTGGSPASCGITEIGAVKVRGGDVLGEFQTLVNPQATIPAFIAVLTGITDGMVASAPTLGAVLPAFLEWARGSVLVAHNAPFDVGFLRAGCERLGLDWPGFDTVDTARLAMRVLTRDETPDCKLATLARLFRTTTTPRHRALDDARATVEVLHALIGRLGTLGVHSVEELRTFAGAVSVAQRRKRHLAEGLPDGPGVYLFRDGADRLLYVGKSRRLRARVRQYFLASEPRARIVEMVGLAERVDHIPCAHVLEAEVRELRLIAEHKPRYNRRSRFPERAVYLKLTVEPFPRLSLVRRILDDGAHYLGPFGSARTAEQAMAALYEAFPLRQCARRLSPRRPSPACALGELGRCSAPCRLAVGQPELAVGQQEYGRVADAVAAAMTRDPRPVLDAMTGRIRGLAAQQRYEDAAVYRDRAAAFVRTAARMQRLAALAGVPELVAARPLDGGWELAVVRYGRLAAAGRCPPGRAPHPAVEAVLATAETVLPGPGPAPCASAEEMECILRWLDAPGVRLARLTGSWSSPAHGAAGLAALWAAGDADRAAARPFADRRALRPGHRPARTGAA